MANSNIDFNGIRANKYSYGKQIIVINGHQYYIQCPSTIDSNTTFYMAGRGAGGIGDTRSTFQQARDSNVIVIAPVHQGDGDVVGTVDVIGLLADAYGIEPNASFSGHSNSGTLALKTAQRYIQTYNKPTMIVLNDPYNCASDSSIDYSLFKDSLIVAYAPTGGGCYEGFKDRCKKAAAAGAKVLVVRYSSGGHGAADDIAAANGAFDLDGFTLKNSCEYIDSYGGTHRTNLSYEYIDEHGKVHKFGSLEEAQAFFDNALLSVSLSLYEKCSNLREFASHYTGKGDTLASNLAYVSNAMDAIKSQITEHSDINYSPSSDGEAAIIGTLYKASNYYGAVTNVLYGNLAAEADAVYGIANAIFKLDNVASMIAETNLTDGVKSLNSSTDPSVTSAVDKLKSVSAELYDTAKNAVMAGGRYEELSGILGTSSSAGSVGKISIGALNSAVNAIVPNLNSEVEKANGLKAGVDDFMSGIGASKILQGGVWEDVKTNMLNYHNLLDCNAKAAEFMSETVKTATMLVIEYIQDAADEISAVNKGKYGNLATIDELDDTKLPELITAIEEVEKNITELQNKITEMENATHQECDQCPGENGGTVSCNCHEVHDFTETDIAPFRTQLTEAEELKTELNAYKGVLEGFAPVVQQAQGIINDAISQVKGSYENPVTDTEGNQTFNSDFSLDFSKYGIDSSKDYAKLLDDYYTQLNPPAPADPTETQNPTETNPVDTTPGTTPGGSPGGSPSGGSPSTPTVPTDPKTEPATERPTEKVTEPVEKPTMAPTEPYTETPTQAPQETKTEAQEVPVTEPTTVGPTEPNKDEPIVERLSSETGGGTNRKPKNPNIDSLEAPSEPEIIDNPEEVVIEPVSSDYQEAIINEPPKVEPIAEQVEDSSKDNKGLKTMGIASGIGLAVGAAALGAHTMVKNKEGEESEEDYGYDK